MCSNYYFLKKTIMFTNKTSRRMLQEDIHRHCSTEASDPAYGDSSIYGETMKVPHRRSVQGVMCWTLLSLLLLLPTVLSVCPNGCLCDDNTLVVSCIEAKFDVIPITLNPSIQRLVLKSNRIRSVDASFQFYGELRFVDLSYNHLVSIPQNSFEAQKKLNELHLPKNKISSVNNSTFSGLKQLTVLNLRGNFLEELGPRWFQHLVNLEELDLGENRISNLSISCFAGLTKLRVLYLDDNQLMSVPTPSLTQLTSLAELKVGLNAFNTLPDDIFRGLSKLAILDVSSSNLANISENAFRGLSTLRSLNLADNHFKVVPTRPLTTLTRLEDLKIGQNLFESLQSGDFTGLFNLRSLEIKGSPYLERIEKGSLSENRNLESLSLISNKKLSEIEAGALTGLPKLKSLVLRDNAFATFSESMVNWSEMRRVDVSKNPLECSCHLLWLRTLLQSREDTAATTVLDPDSSARGSGPAHHPTSQVLCVSPPNLKDKSLRTLSNEELGCASSDPRTQAALVVCLVILLVIVLAALALTLRFRRRVRDALKDTPRWFPTRSASGAAIARKEHEYQKAQLGCGDDDYMIRAAAVSAANTVHGCGHTLKPIPVTEL